MKWQDKDDTNNPDKVRRMVLEVASYLEADLAARALNDEVDVRRLGRKGAKPETSQERRHPKSETVGRRDKRAGGPEQPRMFKVEY